MYVLSEDDERKLIELNKKIAPSVVPITQQAFIIHLPHGTGSLVQYENKCFLVSNYHVYYDVEHNEQFQNLAVENHGRFTSLPCSIVAKKHPYDTGIDCVDSLNSSRLLAFSKFQNAYAPVDGEIFYIIGYPFRSQLLDTKKGDYSYKPEQIYGFEIKGHTCMSNYFGLKCPNLKGVCLNDVRSISGSLVWNTKIIECRNKGIPWSIDMAVVAGIVCKWGAENDDDTQNLDTLICTKIDDMYIPDMIDYWNKNQIGPNSITTI